MAKLVIHGVAPVPRSLILSCTSTLEAKPRPLRTFHVAAADTRFIVQRRVDAASLLVRGQVKLRDDTGNDVIVQVFRVLEGKAFETRPKVETPLTHDVIRDYLLRVWIVRCASHNYVVRISVPGAGSQEHK